MARSSIGEGHRVLNPGRGVRFPYGLLTIGQVVERADTPSSEGGAPKGVGVQLSPWSLFLRMDQCPARPHKPGGQVRLLDPQLVRGRVRKSGKAARSRAW